MAVDDRDALRADLESRIAARKDLDQSYEPALVEAFLERLDAQVDRRVQAEVEIARHDNRPSSGHDLPFVLGLVSLGTGIPITAISAGIEGVPGLIVAWAGIVGVNVAYGLSRRDRRRER
ncbi:MAG: hypothetical protein M3419_05290 [Actinomycetota bacterium]|nr:hypothetical protein [Actinomycetota bacterium]